MGGELLIGGVERWLVAAGLAHPGLFVVRDHELGHAPSELEHPHVRERRVRKGPAPRQAH